jgi:hypothetical protein
MPHPADKIKLCERCEKHEAEYHFDDNWAFTAEHERKPVESLCGLCIDSASIFASSLAQPGFPSKRQRGKDVRQRYEERASHAPR